MATSHILSIKSKRYQPSLGLRGTTLPMHMATLTSPANAIVSSLAINTNVQGNAQVDKDDVLITLSPLADTMTINDTQLVAGARTSAVNNNATNSTAINSNAKTYSPDDLNLETSSKSAQPNAPFDAGNTSNAATQVTNSQDASRPNLANSSPDSMSSIEGINNIDSIDSVDSEDNRSNNDDHDTSTERVDTSAGQDGGLISISAPFKGQIDHLYVKAGQSIQTGQPLIKLSTPDDLQFIATLPIEAQPQLSVGQNVTFSVTGVDDSFTGQVSKLVPAANSNHLLVYVHVIANSQNNSPIKAGMLVSGRIDYGQMQVGTIIPKNGIHGADLSELTKPPYRALAPIRAHVWIIGQDQRLSRQQVEVIEYDPKTDQYLIAGVSNDSLICLANLPTIAEGKKVIVS